MSKTKSGAKNENNKRKAEPGGPDGNTAPATATAARLAGTAPGAGFRLPLGSWLWIAGLCLATAAILSLAFPPQRWIWLAHVALAPLLVATVRSPNKRILVLSAALAGLLFFGSEIYWLGPVDVGGYIGALLLMLPYWPLFALLVYWTSRRTDLPLALLAPVFWVPLELIRGYGMTGFPWLYLGHPQAASPYLLQLADLTGAYGLSALSAATAGLVADFVTRPVFLRYGQKVRLARTLLLASLLLIAAWVFTIGYGDYRLRQDVALTDGPLVATVQSNVRQEVKGLENDPSYEQLTEMTRAALGKTPNIRLVVWPETVVPHPINQTFLDADPRQFSGPNREESLKFQAKSRDCWQELHRLLATGDGRAALLVGTLTHEDTNERFNSALLLTAADKNYTPAARYDKVHLVLFGEYVPFRESAPWLYRLLLGLTPYDTEYNVTAGTALTRLPLGDWRFCTPICFEDAFAGVCRDMVYQDGRKRADFLVNISNDGWFDGTVELEQHWDLSVFRAVENRVPVVRSVNTGISGFIDSRGRAVERVRNPGGQVRAVQGYAVQALKLDPRETFYGSYGDVFAYVLSLAGVSIIILGRFHRRQQTV